MFEIDRIIIESEIKDKKIVEISYSAVFGTTAIKFDKTLVTIDDENIDNEGDASDILDIYRQHVIEARALSIKNHLNNYKQDLDSLEYVHGLMGRRDYDTFTFKKSQRIYDNWHEDLINDYIKVAICFLDFENIKQSMIELDTLAYYKAQKLFWEEKIHNELLQREEDSNKKTNEKEALW